MFTTQHYIKIAEALKDGYDKTTGDSLAANLIISLCDMFAKDNPKFNERKFLDACLGKDSSNAKKTNCSKSS